MSYTKGEKIKYTTALGYGVDDNLPQFDREVPTASESKDDIQPITFYLKYEEDFTHSNSLICREDMLLNDMILKDIILKDMIFITFEASTSRQLEFDESDIENLNVERIRRNIA